MCQPDTALEQPYALVGRRGLERRRLRWGRAARRSRLGRVRHHSDAASSAEEQARPLLDSTRALRVGLECGRSADATRAQLSSEESAARTEGRKGLPWLRLSTCMRSKSLSLASSPCTLASNTHRPKSTRFPTSTLPVTIPTRPLVTRLPRSPETIAGVTCTRWSRWNRRAALRHRQPRPAAHPRPAPSCAFARRTGSIATADATRSTPVSRSIFARATSSEPAHA